MRHFLKFKIQFCSASCATNRSMVKKVIFVSAVVALLFIQLCGCAKGQPVSVVRASGFPAQKQMPDPLVMLNGEKVTSQKQWFDRRRPELKDLFEEYMYGAIPPKPAEMKTVTLGEYDDFLEGKAKLKLVRLET